MEINCGIVAILNDEVVHFIGLEAEPEDWEPYRIELKEVLYKDYGYTRDDANRSTSRLATEDEVEYFRNYAEAFENTR